VPELRAYREACRLQGTDPNPDDEALIITRKLGISMGTAPQGQGQPGAVTPALPGTMEGSAEAASKLATALGMAGAGIPPAEEGQP
jgi:hypothetical protein